jgi:methyl-accepting chemotaxis protein
MNFFKKLSIGNKFSLTFGFIILVVLVLGFSWQNGIDNLKKIEDKQRNLIELKEKLRELQLIHYQWVDNLREAVRKRGKFDGVLDPKQCLFGEWYYSYHLPHPELQELYTSLEDPHDKLHQAGKNVMRALEAGNFAEAERLSLQVRQVFLPTLMKIYTPFMDGIGDVYGKYKAQSAVSVKKQKVFSVAIIFVSVIAVIIVAILLTRGIVVPLKKVTDTARKIAEGDIPETDGIEDDLTDSNNEIDQMEDAFGRMAASLQQLSETAGQIASGNLDARVQIRSENDILGNAIATMVENLKKSVDDLHENSMNLALGMSPEVVGMYRGSNQGQPGSPGAYPL